MMSDENNVTDGTTDRVFGSALWFLRAKAAVSVEFFFH